MDTTGLAIITNTQVRDKILELSENDQILGFFLQGSRVTGFGAPDADWDINIYCTNELFNSLPSDELIFQTYADNTEKKIVGDFSYWCDAIFQDQENSPMDIDHIAYVESQVILDKTGKLTNWITRLKKTDQIFFQNRLKMQMVQLALALGYASINQTRERSLDLKVNLNRFLTISFTVWFTIENSWTPQLKWWSNYVKEKNMDEITYKMYLSCLDNLSFANAKTLYDRLKELIAAKGIELKIQEDFMKTITPEGRQEYLKHSFF